MKTNRRLMAKTGKAIYFGLRRMDFDEKGMHLQTEIIDERVKWKGFKKWGETKNYIFPYVAEHAAQVIPLAKISPDQATELRTMLNTCMSKPAIS